MQATANVRVNGRVVSTGDLIDDETDGKSALDAVYQAGKGIFLRDSDIGAPAAATEPEPESDPAPRRGRPRK